ncbi:MAG: hypothetical protein H0U21_16195 [Acidimicrobiia bacterium]|nr:hypothetical protein [Acidimicrobiia bacterium]
MTGRSARITLPDGVHDRIGRLVARVARDGWGCSHLERVGYGTVCLMHPAAVRCEVCAAAHVRRHSHAEEHVCDRCGGPLDDVDDYLVLLQPFEVDTTVSLGRGRRAAVGVIFVIGFGVCASCVPSVAA